MAEKKRILLINEFHDLATGFSTYGNEVMNRLAKTGKYELAELASYVGPEDPRVQDSPWKVYPVVPQQGNEAMWQQYNAVQTAQFGELALTSCLLDFKPDIVFSIRDPWFDEFILRNPLRNYFKYCWMVTCDGERQKEEWCDWYKRCDVVNTYSIWAKNLLTANGVKVTDVTSPGVDLDVFKPVNNKAAHRESMDIPQDWFIVQTVMRNQPRKLYPNLFKAFAMYLKMCVEKGQHELAAKSFLHIHTSFADMGWELSKEIQLYNLDHKVLTTYKCRETGKSYISFYKGEPAFSRFSGRKSCFTTNTGDGVSREELAKIHQIPDLYIQYSVCEGYGMCVPDAKACGVVTMGISYSATAELNLPENGGIPLKMSGYAQESKHETYQLRARPDDEHTARAIYNFATSKKEYKEDMSKKAVEWSKTQSWDSTAKKWEAVFDNLEIHDRNATWLSPPKIHKPADHIPWDLPSAAFVEWAYTHILGHPEILNADISNKICEQLNAGRRHVMQNGKPAVVQFNKQMFIEELKQSCGQINQLEMHRANIVNNEGKPVVQKPRITVL